MSGEQYGLKDRVIIVTGAGQGIGRVYAHRFAEAGAISVLAELDEASGRRVVADIEKNGGRAVSFETDISSPESVQDMADSVLERFGRIDVLVNNAALFSTLKARPADEIPLEEWQKVLNVNVTGQFLCVRAVLPAMKQAKWGRIINVSSGAVTVGLRNLLHYVTSKSAVIGMTRSLARELGGDGITVNVILPGSIETELPRETITPEQRRAFVGMQCIPRGQRPDDLVGSVLFLASEDSAFITGQSIAIDGGFTHL